MAALLAQNLPRVEQHLYALKYTLARHPVEETHGVTDPGDSLRVFRSVDPVHRYEILAGVRVTAKGGGAHVERLWIESCALDEVEGEPDE